MDPATLAAITALMKHGGIATVAILASYLAIDYRKELRTVHKDRALREQELQDQRATDLSTLAVEQSGLMKEMAEAHAREMGRANGIIGSLQKKLAAAQTARVDDLQAQSREMKLLTREIVEELTRGRQVLESLNVENPNS